MYRKPPKARIARLAASPSMPSIRLMALSINTIIKTVSRKPMWYGISCIPKNPCNVFIYKPEIGKRHAEAICTINFIAGGSPRM